MTSVEELLEGMTNIGQVIVNKTKVQNGGVTSSVTWRIEFLSDEGDLPTLTTDSSALTGTGAHATATTLTRGNEFASGASLRLSYNGATTSNIAFDASPSAMKASLEALASIASVDVTRVGPLNGRKEYAWTVTFTGDANAGSVANMGIDASMLSTTSTGAWANATVATTIVGNKLGGTFDLTYDSVAVTVPFDASATAMKAKIETIPSAGSVDVTVTPADRNGGRTWSVSFTSAVGDLAAFTDTTIRSLTYAAIQGGVSGTVETSAAGANSAIFTIANDGSGAYTYTVTTAGSGYDSSTAGGETIVIKGSQLGGVDGTNDATLTVTGSAGSAVLSSANVAIAGTPATLPTHLTGTGAAVAVVEKRKGTVKEVQQIEMTMAQPWSGSFTVDFGGVNTAPVQFYDYASGGCNATEAALDAALQALAGVGTVTVGHGDVPTGGGCNFLITFDTNSIDAAPVTVAVTASTTEVGYAITGQAINKAAGVAVTQASGSGVGTLKTELSGTSDQVVIVVTSGVFDTAADLMIDGVAVIAANLAIPSLTAAATVIQDASSVGLGGIFTLTHGGSRTGYLPYDATALAVQTALSSLPSTGTVAVTRSDVDENRGYTWTVTFLSNLGDVTSLVADDSSLTGTVASITVVEATKGVAPGFNQGVGGLPLGSHIVTTPGALYHTIATLNQGVNYYVRVSAKNSDVGGGMTSLPAAASPPFVTPMPQRPSSPTAVALTPVSGDSLKLSFAAPASTGGHAADKYRVEWFTSAFATEVQAITIVAPTTAEVQTVTTSASDTDEVQNIRVTGSTTATVVEVQKLACYATAGSFTLAFNGATTAPIAYSATATQLKAALELISTVSTVAITPAEATVCSSAQSDATYKITLQSITKAAGVAVTQTSGSGVGVLKTALGGDSTVVEITVTSGTFDTAADLIIDTDVTVVLANLALTSTPLSISFTSVPNMAGDLPLMTSDVSSLGGLKLATVTEVTQGTAPIGGEFTLSYEGYTTGAIPTGSSGTFVTNALNGLASIGAGGVTVVPTLATNDDLYAVTFATALVGGNAPALVADITSMTGNDAKVTVCTDGSSVAPCVGSSVQGNAIGGTFTLTMLGHTTTPINHKAADSEMKAALEALPNVGTVAVTRTGPSAEGGFVWTISFTSNPGYFPLGSGDMPELTVTTAGTLTGTGAAAAIATTVTGAAPLTGTFTLALDASITASLAKDISAASMELALEGLPTVGDVDVTRKTNVDGYTWSVTFAGCRRHVTNASLIPQAATNPNVTADICNDGNVNTIATVGTLSTGATIASSQLVAGNGGAGYAGYGSYDLIDLSGPSPFSHTVTGLVEGAKYYFKVKAHTQCMDTLGASNACGFGRSTLSSPLFSSPAYLHPGTPLRPTLVKSVSLGNVHSIDVAWKHPPTTGGSHITGYELWMDTWNGGNFRRVYDGRGLATKLWSAVSSADVDGLVANKQYRFKVRALNTAGNGTFSETSTFYVRSASAPLPPPMAKRDALTSGEAGAVFNWAPPIDNGGNEITNYNVHVDDGLGGAFVSDFTGALEKQVIRVNSGVTSGPLSMTFKSITTTISFASTPTSDELKAALESISTVGIVGVVGPTTNAPYKEYTVTFFTNAGDQPELTVDASSLVGTSTGTAVYTIQQGRGTAEVQTVETTVTTGTLGGTFNLGVLHPVYKTSTTVGPIAAGATAQDIVDAFATAIPGVTTEVTRAAGTGTNAFAWTIAFTKGMPVDVELLATVFRPTLTPLVSLAQGTNVTVTRTQRGVLRHVQASAVAGRLYRMYVEATNGKGTSNRSPIVSVVAASVPLQAAAATITAVDATSVSLSWTEPPANGAFAGNGGSVVTGYRVYQFAGVAPNTLAEPSPVKFEVQTIETSAAEPAFEVQKIRMYNATGGYWTIKLGSYTTDPIAYDATDTVVQAAILNKLEDVHVLTVLRSGVVGDYEYLVTFGGQHKNFATLFSDDTLLIGLHKHMATTVVTEGNGFIEGDFAVTFGAHTTIDLASHASAADVKNALENLPGVGVVDVSRVAGAYHSHYKWLVTFTSLPGNVPAMTATGGRLTTAKKLGSLNCRVTVTETTPGSKATVALEAMSPSTVKAMISGLTTDTTYAFAVAAINGAGNGVASAATTTVVATSGASPTHTTASGSALVTSIAGAVYEEQELTITNYTSPTVNMFLKLGASGTETAPLKFPATGSEIRDALMGLAFGAGLKIGEVHVTQRAATNSTGSYRWLITFRGNEGDLPDLVPRLDVLSHIATIEVREYVKGAVNAFTIEPKKASGKVVRDVSTAAGFKGADVFFTELWSTPATVLDGTHAWVKDGGVAKYNPVVYEVQTITSVWDGAASAVTGTFSLLFDSSADVAGVSKDTAAISIAATAAQVQSAIELLGNAGKVDVSRAAMGTVPETYSWSVTFTSLLGDSPTFTPFSTNTVGASVAVKEATKGITEVQTIQVNANSEFVKEMQSIAISTAATQVINGTLAFKLGSSEVATTSYISTVDASTAAVIKTALESLSSVSDVTVTYTYSSASNMMFCITFNDPVGDVLPLDVSASNLAVPLNTDVVNVAVQEVTKGVAPVGGTFVVEFGGETTVNMDFDASAASMKAALESISTIGSVNVKRLNVGNGFQWQTTFRSNLGNLPSLSATAVVHEVQQIATIGGNPTPPLDRTFTLAYGGSTTSSLPFDATDAQVKAALEAMPTVGLVDVNRTGPFGNGKYVWITKFRTNYGNLVNLAPVATGLSGTSAGVTVTELQAGSASSLSGTCANGTVSTANNQCSHLAVNENVAGFPSHTGAFTPATVGGYSLAVRQLRRGGLYADYFDNQWLFGNASLSRIDPTVAFDWGEGLVTQCARDFASVRWTGKITPKTSENYTLTVTSDDGARLYIDHKLVVDTWAASTNSPEAWATVSLAAGSYHDIKLEFKEERGNAACKLEWSSFSVARQVVPKTALSYASHIVGSPYSTATVPSAADYPYTTATPTNTTAGIPTMFIVQAKDVSGNNKTNDYFQDDDAGNGLAVVLSGPGAYKVDVTPVYIGNGKYQCDYVAQVAGAYSYSITMGGTDIYCGSGSANKCSPFAITVAPGPAAYTTSDATGAGLTDAVAGTPAYFSIQAKDAFGNNRWVGGEAFTVEVSHSSMSGVAYKGLVNDSGLGTYAVTYTAYVAGAYTVNVKLNGTTILTAGSATPSALTVVASSLHAPSSTSFGPGLSASEAGLPVSFTVVARDDFDNVRGGDRSPANLGTGSGTDDAFRVRVVGGGVTYLTSTAVIRVRADANPGQTFAGSFALQYKGKVTAALPADVAADAMQVQVEALAPGTLVNVSRATDFNGFHWNITFVGTSDPREVDAVGLCRRQRLADGPRRLGQRHCARVIRRLPGHVHRVQGGCLRYLRRGFARARHRWLPVRDDDARGPRARTDLERFGRWSRRRRCGRCLLL